MIFLVVGLLEIYLAGKQNNVMGQSSFVCILSNDHLNKALLKIS